MKWNVDSNSLHFWEIKQIHLKSSFAWDITTCRPLKINLPFRVTTFCLHLQGRRLSQGRNHHEASSKQVDFQWTTRCSNPEAETLHNSHCGNLISCIYCFLISERQRLKRAWIIISERLKTNCPAQLYHVRVTVSYFYFMYELRFYEYRIWGQICEGIFWFSVRCRWSTYQY
jgi:hypothetical protein